jgi:hypothetical protein
MFALLMLLYRKVNGVCFFRTAFTFFVLVATDDEITVTRSPACEKMQFWKSQWLLSSGYGHLGTSPALGHLLREVGCVNVQFMPHVLDFSTGTALHESQYQNYMVWPILNKSFLIDADMTTEEEFDQTYHQMLETPILRAALIHDFGP